MVVGERPINCSSVRSTGPNSPPLLALKFPSMKLAALATEGGEVSEVECL